MKYEEMKPHEINAVLNDCPIAYLVWGAHEWHGPHTVTGLDTIKAYRMTLELCKITGGIVLPPVYCGYQTMKPFRGFKHTFEFSKSLVMQYVYEHLENIYEEGFKVIVIVMGHYGGKHVEAVKQACDIFKEKHKYPRVFAIRDFDPASWINVKGGDHGGKNETSILMYFRPDLVDMSRLPDEKIKIERYGIVDTAPQANAEHGKYLVETFVAQAAPKIKQLLSDACDEWPDEIISE